MTDFSQLKIALISDSLTRECLSKEVNILNVTPWNYIYALKVWKPDLLLVESVWNGFLNSWKYKVASYPNKNNSTLKKVVKYSRDLNIPTVFWNKEDGVHFDRFIHSASLFDKILTVDSNCIEKYKENIRGDINIDTLMFAAQPKIHSFVDFNYKYHRACFAGSYNNHEHNQRRKYQNIFFTSSNKFGLDIYDRHSNRKAKSFKFPENLGDNIKIKKGVGHSKTADIYRDYIVSFNINTVTDSETMFSRRLIEVLACGRVVLTNPSLSIDKLFKEYCHIATSSEEVTDILESLKHGYDAKLKEKLKEGSDFIKQDFSYNKRIQEILNFIN